jgi:hypothetical protein
MDLQITQPKARKKATKPLLLSEFDDGGAVAPLPVGVKPLPPRRTAAVAEKVTKKKPLFINSDDDDENHGEDNLTMDVDPTAGNGGVTVVETLQSSLETRQTAGGRRSTRSKKPAVFIVDDDSDDDAVFKGFKGQKKGRS